MGYAPAERFALKEHLGEQGVPVADMVETGLLIAGDDIPVPYDRFRDRVMFPITDFRGRIIAFGGRALSPDAPAKYLNSPETPLFHKGSNLYNGAAARTGGARRRAADRGRRLRRRDRDGDGGLSGDRRAARHRADRGSARPALEDGRRADPVLRRRQGRPARRLSRASTWRCRGSRPARACASRCCPKGRTPTIWSAPAAARRSPRCWPARAPLADMLWTRETEAASLDTPERRAALEARINEIVRGIGDETVRKILRRRISSAGCAQLMAPQRRRATERPRGASATLVRAASRRRRAAGRGRGSGIPGGARPVDPGRGAVGAAERASCPASPIVRGLPHRAAAARGADADDGDQPSLAAGTPRRGVRRARIPQSRRRPAPPGDPGRRRPTATPRRPTPRRCGRRSRRAGLPACLRASRPPSPTARTGRREAGTAVLTTWRQWWTHVVTLHRKQRTLNRELKDAERALGEEPTDANLAWLRDVQARLSALDGSEAQIEGFGLVLGPRGRAASRRASTKCRRCVRATERCTTGPGIGHRFPLSEQG